MVMARSIIPEDISLEDLKEAYQNMAKRHRKLIRRYNSIKFRHDAALEFFHEMEIFDEYSAWVQMKAKLIGL